jgi:hypothetical protein
MLFVGYAFGVEWLQFLEFQDLPHGDILLNGVFLFTAWLLIVWKRRSREGLG